MKHHFTNSERLALEAYYHLRRMRGQLQEGFSDMESSRIRTSEWRSYPYTPMRRERSTERTITFCFERLARYVPHERPYYLRVHLKGYEEQIRGSPVRQTHWNIEKVELGYFTAIAPETPDGIRWERIHRETFGENHLLLWGFDADSDEELQEPQRAHA